MIRRFFTSGLFAMLLALNIGCGSTNPAMRPISGTSQLLPDHDGHVHHAHCGHPRSHHQGQWVYFYQGRWEYYDQLKGSWFAYR